MRIASHRRYLCAVLLALVLTACQTTQTGSAETAPTLILTTLEVDENLSATIPYAVSLPYQIVGEGTVTVRQACFTWSGEGPYCFNAQNDSDNKTITVRLHTNNPNTYVLAGFVEYVSNGWKKQSNTVSQIIDVK